MYIPVRWSDNTDELKGHLKEGLNQIEATRASVDKLVKSLGGDNIIAAAHKYAAAVQEVGGAAKLTASNQERVNSVMSKAVDQLERAGKGSSDLANHFRDLATATKSVSTGLSTVGTSAGTAQGFFGTLQASVLSTAAGFVTGQAIINGVSAAFKTLVSGALEAGDVLQKMADRTGIGVVALQKLQAVGDASGNTIEELTAGINKMQQRLSKGDASAVSAITELGLSLSQLQALKPEDQFATIAQAIGRIADPAKQVELAMALFGKAGAELLPTLKSDIRGLGDAAVTMSEDTVKALDAAGDAWKKFKRDATAQAGEFFGYLAEQNKQAILDAEAYGREIKSALRPQFSGLTPFSFPAKPLATGAPLPSIGMPSAELMDYYDFHLQLLTKRNEELLAAQKKLAEEAARAAKEYADAWTELVSTGATVADTIDTIDAKTLEQVTYYLRAGNSVSTLAKAFPELTTAQVQAVEAGLKGAEAYAKKWEEVQKGIDAVWKQTAEATHATEGASLGAALARLDDKQAAERAAAVSEIADATQREQKLTAIDALYAQLRTNAQTVEARSRGALLLGALQTTKQVEAETLALTLSTIDAQLAKLQEARDSKLNEWLYPPAGMEAEWQRNIDLINGYYDKLVDNLYVDNQALEDNSTAHLQTLANKNWETYARMAAAPDEFSKETIAHFREIAQASQNTANGMEDVWGQAIAHLGSMFSQLAQAAGNLLNGDLGRAFGTLGGTMQNLQRARAAQTSLYNRTGQMGRAGIASPLFSSGASTSERVGAGIDSAGAIVQGGFEIADATSSHRTAAGNALGGALAGAKMGAAFGPYGMAIGAAAGLIVGIIRGKPAWAKAADEVGRDFGVKISDALGKEIADKAKTDYKGNRQAASLSLLDKIIAEDGGLTTTNVDKYTAKLRDVFVMVQTGAMTAAQATEVLDKNFAAMAQVGTDSLGFLSDGLKEIIKLDETAGTKSKAIAEYLKAQGAAAVQGSNLAIGSLKIQVTAWQDLASRIATAKANGDDYTDLLKEQGAEARRNKDDLETLGVIAVATFAAAVASGATFAEALAAAGPGLQTLAASFEALGISTTNAGLQALMFQSTLLEKTPELIQGIGGLGASFVALSNMGLLNVDTFHAMQAAGQAMYTRIQGQVAAMGGGTRDALLPMQDYLHQAEKAAKDLGVPLDENTVSLIAQSKELGIWKEAGKSATEKLTDGMQTLVDKVGKLIDKLNGIPDVDYDVTQHDHHVDDPNPPPPPPPSGPPDPSGPGFATGGIVPRTGRFPVLPNGDSERIWATPGELVLNNPQQQLLMSMLSNGAPLAPSATSTSSATVLAPVIVLVDRGASDAVIIDKTLAALPDAVRRNNPAGVRSDLINALGLAPTTWAGR